MKHIKRISFLLAIIVLLLMSFSFPASAAGNEVSIVWGKYTYTFDATGCSTWAELADTADAGYEGLFIADNGYAYFEYDFDNSFPIVDQDGVSVKGTDQITDATYTFGVISLSFGNEFEHFISLGAAANWFDIAGSTDHGAITTDEGDSLLYYQVDGVGQFGIYNAAGQRVDENDEINETHYTLKLLTYSFTIEEYKDGTPTGTVHTLTASGVDNWRLYNFLDNDTVFECDTLEDCHFEYHNEADNIVVLCVTPSGGSTVTRYCLLSSKDLSQVVHCGSSLEPGAYYAVDPCSINYHSCTAYENVKEATCTDQGEAVRTCKFCGHVEYKHTEALGHDYNIWGTCRRCDHNRVVEGWNNLWGIDGDSSGDGSGSDKNIFDQVGDKVDEFGNSIKDWADGIKNDTTSFFKTIMTVIFIVLLIFLIPKGLKWVRKIIEAIGEAARSIVVFFQWMLQPVTRKRKRAYRR